MLQRRLLPGTTTQAFRAVVADAESDVRALVGRLTAGELSPDAWQAAMTETLAQAHAEAAYRGRVRAGDHAPFERDDERFGYLVAQEEQQYLWRFRQDIEAGRYGVEEPDTAAIVRRVLLYTQRLYGTANEALALTADDEDVWHWEAEPDPCPDCSRLAAHSPYRGMPPTMPGQCETKCLVNCRCVVYSTSGLRGFEP